MTAKNSSFYASVFILFHYVSIIVFQVQLNLSKRGPFSESSLMLSSQKWLGCWLCTWSSALLVHLGLTKLDVDSSLPLLSIPYSCCSLRMVLVAFSTACCFHKIAAVGRDLQRSPSPDLC